MTEVDRHLIGLWFVPLPGHQGHDNWLGALSRLPDGRLRFVQRLRYCDPLEPGADPRRGTRRERVVPAKFTFRRAPTSDLSCVLSSRA